MNKKLIFSIVAVVLLAVVVTHVVFAAPASAPRDENRLPKTDGSSCEAGSVAQVGIGTGNAIVLASTTNRAYARIQQVRNSNGVATSSVFLSFANGAPASTITGIELSTSTPYIEFGLNTAFPYTGVVTATGNNASTTVQVTTCLF